MEIPEMLIASHPLVGKAERMAWRIVQQTRKTRELILRDRTILAETRERMLQEFSVTRDPDLRQHLSERLQQTTLRIEVNELQASEMTAAVQEVLDLVLESKAHAREWWERFFARSLN